jgi:predicted nucleic acid-binding protein
MSRDALFERSPLKPAEREAVLDALLNTARWVEVFYAWRPNLPDEGDNHLIELAVAGQAQVIVSRNLRDLTRGELRFPGLQILGPEQCLEVFPCPS